MLIKDGKIFGKINMADFVIAVLLILGIAVLGYGAAKIIIHNKMQYTCEYKLIVRDIRSFSADAFLEGDDIYDLYKQNMGTILKKTVEPHEGIILKTDGIAVKAVNPDTFDVTLIVKAICKDKKNSGVVITLDGHEISIGNTISLATKRVAFEADVLSVEILDKE